jgi:hypothetical protein
VAPTLLLLIAALAARAAPLEAQSRTYSPEEGRWLDAGVAEEIRFAAINALVSGVVAGLFREYGSDGAFLDGLRGGAAGGAISYLGKRVAVARPPAAGFAGRQLASLGGSITANAREGRGALDRVVLQAAIGRVYWDRIERTVSFRPDVITLYYTAVAASDDRLDLDWGRSLSAGAPVFLTNDRGTLDQDAAGRAFGGLVIADVNATIPLDDIVAHERIHVVQFDQAQALWGEPTDRGVLSLLPSRPAGWLGYADLGIGIAAISPFRSFFTRGRNPLEIEADFLTVR